MLCLREGCAGGEAHITQVVTCEWPQVNVKRKIEILKSTQEIRQRCGMSPMETGRLQHKADLWGRSEHSKERMWRKLIPSGSRGKGESVLSGGQC